jgi:hypothetical protein
VARDPAAPFDQVARGGVTGEFGLHGFLHALICIR